MTRPCEPKRIATPVRTGAPATAGPDWGPQSLQDTAQRVREHIKAVIQKLRNRGSQVNDSRVALAA